MYTVKRAMFEIFKLVAEEQNTFQKVETLKQYNSASLRKLLRYAIDPKIKFLLEEPLTPYRPAPEAGLDLQLYNQARLLYLFVERSKKLDISIMNRCLIEMLEAVHPKDAELILQVMKKKLPKGLTKQHILQAFPEILNEQIQELA